MLKGINPILSPELLKILCEMGHSDEIVIADANFPSENYGKRIVRADGTGGNEMLKAILSLIPLDTYSEANFLLMELSGNDTVTPKIWHTYEQTAEKIDGNVRIKRIDRFDFYERTKSAYAVIATGETAVYANIILKKGVIKH